MRRAALGALVVALAACDGGGSDDAATVGMVTGPLGVEDCIVRVHGRSDRGAEPTVVDGVGELQPPGNRPYGDGRMWLYFPDDAYEEARAVLVDAVEAAGCERVVLDGFSNGAAFVATLHCRGEDLGGRLAGVVIDDPVTDAGTEGCAPAAGVEAVLYWTGALEAIAPAGTDCATVDFTCLGGTSVGIDAYAAALGVEIIDSPFDDHSWYRDAPELSTWLSSLTGS